jgi:hypothetical protein
MCPFALARFPAIAQLSLAGSSTDDRSTDHEHNPTMMTRELPTTAISPVEERDFDYSRIEDDSCEVQEERCL